jgi:hypothetical protein
LQQSSISQYFQRAQYAQHLNNRNIFNNKEMNFNQISPILFAAMLLSACDGGISNQAGTPNAALAPQPTAPPPAVKPEVYLYAVMVDKLNLREQPNKDGKVVGQFPEGDFVTGTGEVSPDKEEVTLRGMYFNEPYLKVTSMGTAPKSGWAYGGALQRIYAGPNASSPDLSKLTPLTGFLKTLNVKKLESGKKAWDFVKTNYASSSGTVADAAFILLERFFRRMETEGEFYKLTEAVQWADTDYEAIYKNTFDATKYPVTKNLAENGFGIATGEGMVFPVTDWSKLRDFFAPKTTPAMKAFIEQHTAEENTPMYEDGGLIVPIEKVAERAVFWEKFNQLNPDFVLNEQTKESQMWMRNVILNGADNTPMYEYESQTVNEEYKKTWADIQQKYPGTELARQVKQVADLCAAEGWKRTKKVEDLQMKLLEQQ